MNNKSEIRYDLILGFLTVVISLSAFKEELSKLKVDLGFISFSISQFFFLFIIGITISFYLYSIERLFNTLTIKQFKLLRWIRMSAYWIFILFTILPVSILFLWLLALINVKISEFIKLLLFGFVGGVIGYVTTSIFNHFIKARKDKEIEQLELKEIIELETSEKLFEQNFYSQSIIETNKVIQTALNRFLVSENIDANRIKFFEITKYCLEKKIITNEEFLVIEKIRKLRNDTVHLNIINTREEAEQALKFAKKLIRNTILM